MGPHLADCEHPMQDSGGVLKRTGLNSTSIAVPGLAMMEMAWSIPPDSVPTYFSHFAVNVATSCQQDINNKYHSCRPRATESKDCSGTSLNPERAALQVQHTVLQSATPRPARRDRAEAHTRAEELDRPDPTAQEERVNRQGAYLLGEADAMHAQQRQGGGTYKRSRTGQAPSWHAHHTGHGLDLQNQGNCTSLVHKYIAE